MHQAVYKVAEFVAHSAEVLDVNIGRKSGDLLATCGADRKVNIWSLQSGNNLMVRAARNAMPPLRTTPCHNPHGFETPTDSSAVEHASGSGPLCACTSGLTRSTSAARHARRRRPASSRERCGRPRATRAVAQSLSGHTSSVECVAFDQSEESIVAGSSGGTLKLWDLERGKVARTLTGHRSNCLCVAWHPYGEFFASGSSDTNLKVWDIRRKACIQTYKGHGRGVSRLSFSPDGRWIASGGDDGSVRLWDLTMGAQLCVCVCVCVSCSCV
jgi:WD40 repeat protein